MSDSLQRIGSSVIFNNKLVGNVYGSKYVSIRRPDKHFFRKGKGYPVSDVVLRYLDGVGVGFVVIIEQSSECKSFKCKLSDYLKGSLISEGGFEGQRFIPLKNMSLTTR